MDFLGLGGALLGGLFGGDGGGGTQTTDRSPWIGAQPWINANIAAGQDLQSYYKANPFNQAQTRAYGNMAATSDYIRSQIPQLLSSLNGGSGGFDRSNVNARPSAFQFGNGSSNLGLGPAYGTTSASLSSSMTPPPAPAASPTRVPTDYEKWHYGGLTADQWNELTRVRDYGGV